MTDPNHERPATGGGFDYFMVRVARSAEDPGRVVGQVERLGTGEKHSFRTGDQLARLMADWPGTVPGDELER